MVMLSATVELLRRVPILGSLSNNELQRIIDAPDNRMVSFDPYQVAFAEGDPADCMYLVLEGVFEVRVKSADDREITIATIKTGEYFGEQALMPGSSGRRNAGVRALTQCKAFRIAGNQIATGMAKVDALTQLGEDGTVSRSDQVRMLLRSVRLFRSISPTDLERVSEWTAVEAFDAGDIILREDDPGDFMYVVLDGRVEVFAMDEEGKVVVLGQLGKGQYFGEQALLPGGSGKHNSNVRADTTTLLVRVSKRHVQAIIKHDKTLFDALQAVGEAQRKRKIEAIGGGDDW
jgi:CRP-like cAMP-binding protein